MRCLVTGGFGFIGSHLVMAMIRRGWQVKVMDHRPWIYFDSCDDIMGAIECIPHNIMTCPSLDQALEDTDVLVHLGWTTVPGTSMQAPEEDVSSNVISSLRIFKKALEKNVQKIVFSSSGGTVYGRSHDIPISEEHPTDPISSYGVSKLTTEKYLQCFHHVTGVPIVIFRFANAYGPGQRHDRGQGLIAALMAKILRGEELVIWGDGSVVRDYVYVENIVEAIIAGIEMAPSSVVFNIGTGHGFSVLEILEHLKNATLRKFNVSFVKGRPFDVPINVLDWSRASRELHWHPKTSLEEGMLKTWQWIRLVVDRP